MVVLQQIVASVGCSDFEVVCSRPFRLTLNLIPAIDHFDDFHPLASDQTPARRLVGFVPGVRFDLDWSKVHPPVNFAHCLWAIQNYLGFRRSLYGDSSSHRV
jgi:hypothetical protein